MFEALPQGHRLIWRVAVGLMVAPVLGFVGYVVGLVWTSAIKASGGSEVGDYATPATLAQGTFSLSMILGFVGLLLFLGLLFLLRRSTAMDGSTGPVDDPSREPHA